MTYMIDKFLQYIKIDTTSDENSSSCPSTAIQWDLAHLLVEDLRALGLEDITLDDNGYIMATLPANTNKPIPTIGFIAHMDTAPSFNGTNVNPRIIYDYDGQDICLNTQLDLHMTLKDFPELAHYQGQDLIVTDGTTLLGADDKAGIVEILDAVKYLIEHPEIPHGKIRLGFTPDEEIGRGANLFDVEKFGADFAYTMDGGTIGELEYENFNASSAKIRIQGRNIHPGTAKNKMINALLLAMELNGMLPVGERPELTAEYEGFFLLTAMSGDVENAQMHYIIRDHHMARFQRKKALLADICQFMQQKYPDAKIECTITDSYFNMREKIEPVYHIIELAKKSMEDLGIKPIIQPIRGGTDGARLSFMGLPCPNIFTGGHNFHGKFEYIPIQSMQKASALIVKIVENLAKK